MTDTTSDRDRRSHWRERMHRFFVGRSLEECVERGETDNVLQLRLGAAILVLLGHSYAVLGSTVGHQEPMHYLFPGTLSHITGVMLFFMISGFLITLSWLRRPELPRFLRARALRIWPALFVCVAVTALVIGPVVTTWSLHTYFLAGDSQGTAIGYILNNAVLNLRHTLPGVFERNPIPRYLNGSLWTLPIEATLYVCVAALGAFRCLRYPWIASLGIALVFSSLILRPMYFGHPLPWFGYVLAGFFGAGSIACLLRRYIYVSSGIMLVILTACVLSRYTTHLMPCNWLAIGYFTLWFCYVPRLPAIPHGLDLSYGTYLWAFPVQQCIVLAGVHRPLLVFAVAAPIALALGAASWICIERPALRLKDTTRARHVGSTHLTGFSERFSGYG